MDNAPDTLISIANLSERGVETRFNQDLGVGLFYNEQLLYRGRQNPRTKLYELDLFDLTGLTLPKPPDQHPDAHNSDLDHSNPELSSGNFPSDHYHTARAAKQPPLDPTLIREVLWLHKRMGHP